MGATKYPLVEILWFDAEVVNDWKTEGEIKSDSLGEPVTTVGFLIRKPTKKEPTYFIAGTIANMTSIKDENLYNQIIKIPKVWVKSFRELPYA